MRYLKVSAKKQEPPAPRVFISYSRKDSAFVRRLFEMLQARQLTAWVDWEGIPGSAEWWGEIQSAIQEAEAFIFVMSADSLGSTVCQEELAHAVKHNKRLILYLGGRAARAPGDAGRGATSADNGRLCRLCPTPARLAEVVGRVLPIAETVTFEVGLYREVLLRCPLA